MVENERHISVYSVQFASQLDLMCKINCFVYFQIEWGACALAVSGSIVVFLTILGYFYVFANDDLDYSMW